MGARHVLALVNTAGDDYSEIEVRLGDALPATPPTRVYSRDLPDGRAVQCRASGAHRVLLEEPLRRLQTRIFTWPEG